VIGAIVSLRDYSLGDYTNIAKILSAYYTILLVGFACYTTTALTNDNRRVAALYAGTGLIKNKSTC